MHEFLSSLYFMCGFIFLYLSVLKLLDSSRYYVLCIFYSSIIMYDYDDKQFKFVVVINQYRTNNDFYTGTYFIRA